ncbi:Protein FAR-RED ELONGATED HYPOCOTYL 1 [Melia azedarach]|uniref:Protein FAR-RED ELONGATED HYPOCOTYL 1 n=1 Tax=Melia azedarach TaxID=155640 RepID=A0ACC1X0E9_MELAZ|nr:Protein FAR-RED ELONGATED HYPOCOTYL 1 [Melia azedarach]
MEVDNVNPSEMNSFHINEIRRIAVIDLNKKRKLQAEQLGLPVAKLKCSDGSFPPKSLATLDENPEAEDLLTNIIKGGAMDDGFENDSAKDSNSVAEDSDSSMSVHGESKFQVENGKSWPFDRPSSSSFEWGSSSFNDPSSSDSAAATESESGTEQFTLIGEEHHNAHHVRKLHMAENLGEHLTERGSHAEYHSRVYGHDSSEQFTENEIEEILNSNEENPNIYVLSSGRWSANQETQRGKRRPTIDQEFEQYFSTLML